MSEETRKILELLDQKKISVDEAERLMNAVGVERTDTGSSIAETANKPKPKFLRVLVNDQEDKVDVRVPLQMIRAGIKLGTLIPQNAQAKFTSALEEKGIKFDLASFKPEDVESLIEAFADLHVDVNSDKGNVRVFCE